MRVNKVELMHSLWRGAIEILVFAPIFIIPGVYILGTPNLWLWLLLLPIYYVLGFLAASIFRPSNMGITLLLLLGLSAPINLVVPGLGWEWLFTLSVAVLLSFRGMRQVSVPWHHSFPAIMYISGLIVYFFSAVILWFIDSFAPYISTLNTFGIISLIVAFFFLSQSNLKKGSLPGSKEAKLSPQVLLQNSLWIGLLVALIFIIVLFGRIRDLFLWIRDKVTEGIQYILQKLLGGSPSDLEIEDEGYSVDIGIGEGGGSASSSTEWLNQVILVIVSVVVLVIIVFIIIFVAKRLPGLVRKLWSWLQKVMRIDDKQHERMYDDENEKLIDFKGWRDKMADQFKDWAQNLTEKEAKWSDLNNRERVRLLYRQAVMALMKNGYEYKKYQTIRERNTDIAVWKVEHAHTFEQLNDVYEDVRYGEKDVDDETINQLRHSAGRK